MKWAFLAVALGAAQAKLGVDVSTPLAVSDWQCLQQAGFGDFAIVRGYSIHVDGGPGPDPAGPPSIVAARAAGIARVDSYIYPCFNCAESAAEQVNATVAALAAGGAAPDMMWLDVEGPDDWSADPAANNAFLQELAAATEAAGLRWGVYTSASQWEPITGNATYFSAAPLWFPRYDSDASFDDFVETGGWTLDGVVAKQYEGDATECGLDVDRDYGEAFW